MVFCLSFYFGLLKMCGVRAPRSRGANGYASAGDGRGEGLGLSCIRPCFFPSSWAGVSVRCGRQLWTCMQFASVRRRTRGHHKKRTARDSFECMYRHHGQVSCSSFLLRPLLPPSLHSSIQFTLLLPSFRLVFCKRGFERSDSSCKMKAARRLHVPRARERVR